MRTTLLCRSALAIILTACWMSASSLSAATWDPAAADYSGNTGKTFYVSKQGDNSDGSSWQKAFHTIQAALLAVPDDKGGHRIIVRPDTYMEANLYPSQKGAAGSYNLIIGDEDGSLGSRATGRVIIDCSDPEKGLKAYDWWGPIRSYLHAWRPQYTGPTFSAIGWDRWIWRRFYVTGGDGGLFWDLVDKSGQQFTVIVEDCVSIGRAFGCGLGYAVERKGEPSVFRRCYMMCLDWAGDAGALAVGAYNTSPPESPDVVCEDCTMVSPDNAVQILFPNKYIRVKLKNCRLISLNFTQPIFTESTGIIGSVVAKPEQAHLDFEDCLLMGYKMFGSRDPKKDNPLCYTTKGKVQAYLQFEQTVPNGFERLARWPVEAFDSIAVPMPTSAPNKR